jgi:class 3 adenylate cyclase
MTADQKGLLSASYTTLSLDDDGEPYLCEWQLGRAFSLCNYPIQTKRTFTVHDIFEDESFAWIAKPGGFRFYSGSPVIIGGHVVATLCLLDYKPRPDFTPAHEIQQEQIASFIAQHIELWSLRCEMKSLETARKLSAAHREKTLPPEEQAALIFTEVEGSTVLWETNPDALSKAIALHDQIMRQCFTKHNGYEVTTGGDPVCLAFHDCLDAVSFALTAQEALYDAPWDDDILALPGACDDGKGFRGLRVRMAIHYGDVECHDNEVTGRREYSGPTVHIASSLAQICHGGQILLTNDVWRSASFLAESALRSPRVVDLGAHVFWTGKSQHDGVISKGVVEIVPAKLAHDYFASRRLSENHRNVDEEASHVSMHDMGRQFLPPISSIRISPSFHDAPFKNNVVTIAFVNTSQVEKLVNDPSDVLALLAKLIGTLLGSGPGYQCKNFMVAFQSLSEAVTFGIRLLEHLRENKVAGLDLGGLVQIGVHEGIFTSMGPHQMTGRADYFGKVVNRAARIAGAAKSGQVFVGVVGSDKPELEPQLNSAFVEWTELRGVLEKMALYVCTSVGTALQTV